MDYHKKYLKYKKKYLNQSKLFGGTPEDAKSLKLDFEFILDKFFFHALAIYHNPNSISPLTLPGHKLNKLLTYDIHISPSESTFDESIKPDHEIILCGRKAKYICNPLEDLDLEDLDLENQVLYTLKSTTQTMNIDKFVKYLNAVYPSIIYSSPAIIYMIKNISGKYDIKDLIDPFIIFSNVNNNIYFTLNNQNKNIYLFCTFDNTTKPTNIYEYLIRQFTYHYNGYISTYGIKIEIPQKFIDCIDLHGKTPDGCISNKILTLNDKSPLEHFASDLLLQNDKIMIAPDVYTNPNGQLHNLLSLFTIFDTYINRYFVFLSFNRIIEIGKTSSNVSELTHKYIFHIAKRANLINNINDAPNISLTHEIINEVIKRYMENSSSINTKLLSTDLQNLDIFLDENAYYYKLHVYLYTFLFMNIANDINKKILGEKRLELTPFKVYSVSQKIENRNKTNKKFEKNDIYTFPAFKSTTLAKNYPEHPRFIGNDIFPLVFEITIDCNNLNGDEFFFANSDQFEIILSVGSQIRIDDITRCYTYFKNDNDTTSLLQNCMLIKATLMRNSYNTKLTLDHFNNYELPQMGGLNPYNESQYKENNDMVKIKTNIDYEKMFNKINVNNIVSLYMQEVAENIIKNPFELYDLNLYDPCL